MLKSLSTPQKHLNPKGITMKRNLIFAALAFVGGIASANAAQSAQGNVQSGELRAPSPLIVNWDRPGYFQFGLGPSFASNAQAPEPMWDLNFAYNYNVSNSFTAKAITDFNFGGSNDAARMINLALGVDAYFPELNTIVGTPYFGVDAGYSFLRNTREQTLDAPAIGATVGFKFAVDAMNFDMNAHYALMTAQLNGETPSIFAVRVATNF
jgi:hypothetical protein